MPLKGLSRRHLRGRRGVILLSLAALSLTLGGAALANNPDTVGPSMLLPWVALLAFEVGPAAGLAASVTSFGLFLLLESENGLTISPTFVSGRLASFALIGLGLGVAGRRLQASERRSRRLVEGLPLVMYVEDDGGLTYISPQIEELLGYPLTAWQTEAGLWRRAVDRRDRERVIGLYSAAVAARTPFECEYRLVGANGSIVWVRDSSTYVGNGKGAYRQGFIVDVTLQKESEARAVRNAMLMRSLIDGTVDGVTLTDREGRIVIANQPMRQFAAELRIPPEGLMHERLLAIEPGVADRERYAGRMRELASDPDTASCDEFALREGERVFQGFTKPVVGAEDEYLGRVWTLREVTEARQIDRIKDALVATVSHELRTPLTSIIGYLELLGTSGVTLGDEDARYVEIVRRNAARLQHMVEELLFVARVDAEGLSLDLDNVNLSELARDAIGSALPLATAKEVALELEALPSARACVDAKRISQVLDNLISNAIKFTSTGGNVKVTISSKDAAVVMSIADDGCGIPRSEQPKLFERFFRSSSTNHLPGTGLGLTVVRSIVEAHGGSITCSSDEGMGTTFTLSLPVSTLATDLREASAPTELELLTP